MILQITFPISLLKSVDEHTALRQKQFCHLQRQFVCIDNNKKDDKYFPPQIANYPRRAFSIKRR